MDRAQRTAKTRSTWLALVLIAITVLAGCAPRRSPQAFCRTLVEEKQRRFEKSSQREAEIADKARQDDLLSWLLEAVGSGSEAIRDMTVTFHKLEEVAPEEILPDVEAVGDALEHQQQVLESVADNPVGALADSLTSRVATMGAWHRVSTYASRHCGTRP